MNGQNLPIWLEKIVFKEGEECWEQSSVSFHPVHGIDNFPKSAPKNAVNFPKSASKIHNQMAYRQELLEPPRAKPLFSWAIWNRKFYYNKGKNEQKLKVNERTVDKNRGIPFAVNYKILTLHTIIRNKIIRHK